MHLRVPLTAPFIVVLFLFSTLLTGCGGGGQTGNGGSQDGAGDQGGQAGEAAQKKGKSAEFKVALGKVGRVDTEAERFVLQPSVEEQGERIVFKVGRNARFTQAGEKVELADVEQGQQAQVKYRTIKERSIAIVVTLFEGEGAAPEGGETPKGGEKTG